MAKATNLSKSDKVLTLFQNKKFTLIFFLAVFALLGGAFYLMQSSAGGISVSGCYVKSSGLRSDFTVRATNKAGTVLGSGRANTSFRIKTPVRTAVYASAGATNIGFNAGYIGTTGPC